VSSVVTQKGKQTMELNELNLTEEQLSNVQKLIQSAEDRVRTKYSNELKEVREELNQYKPKEKSPDEISLEERIKALEAREAEIASKEKASQLASELTSKGVPAELAKYLGADANVEEVATLLNAHFLEGNFKPQNHGGSDGITREQFKRMSYMERTKLFQENPELYKMLSQ
jgi:thymidylate synthase ThyX